MEEYCFGCKFLITETDEKDPSLTRYRCKHFPDKIIGLVSASGDEFEEPEPITRRCYRPKSKKVFQY
jgi:hypothetical protein